MESRFTVRAIGDQSADRANRVCNKRKKLNFTVTIIIAVPLLSNSLRVMTPCCIGYFRVILHQMFPENVPSQSGAIRVVVINVGCGVRVIPGLLIKSLNRTFGYNGVRCYHELCINQKFPKETNAYGLVQKRTPSIIICCPLHDVMGPVSHGYGST